MKVYIRLGRASFRLRYEEWKRERKRQAAQAEAVAALEVEQLRRMYEAEGLTLPSEDGVLSRFHKPVIINYLRLIITVRYSRLAGAKRRGLKVEKPRWSDSGFRRLLALKPPSRSCHHFFEKHHVLSGV